MFLIFFAIIFSILTAVVASKRGGSFILWAFLGFFFGIFALIFAFIVPGMDCPTCMKRVSKNATKCPYCHEAVYVPSTYEKYNGKK